MDNNFYCSNVDKRPRRKEPKILPSIRSDQSSQNISNFDQNGKGIRKAVIWI